MCTPQERGPEGGGCGGTLRVEGGWVGWGGVERGRVRRRGEGWVSGTVGGGWGEKGVLVQLFREVRTLTKHARTRGRRAFSPTQKPPEVNSSYAGSSIRMMLLLAAQHKQYTRC